MGFRQAVARLIVAIATTSGPPTDRQRTANGPPTDRADVPPTSRRPPTDRGSVPAVRQRRDVETGPTDRQRTARTSRDGTAVRVPRERSRGPQRTSVRQRRDVETGPPTGLASRWSVPASRVPAGRVQASRVPAGRVPAFKRPRDLRPAGGISTDAGTRERSRWSTAFRPLSGRDAGPIVAVETDGIRHGVPPGRWYTSVTRYRSKVQASRNVYRCETVEFGRGCGLTTRAEVR